MNYRVDAPGHEVDYSSFPLVHGEKSVIVLLQYRLDMSDDGIIAIRRHMNAWDLPSQLADLKGNYNKVKDICPLLSLIQASEGHASNLLESKM